MLLRSRTQHRGGLRNALHEARETYREYSGANASAGENGSGGEDGSRAENGSAPVPARGENGSAPVPARAEPTHAAERPREALVRNADPDVVLDVPNLKVEEIDLELDHLKARVALEAHVLDLLRLDVGVDASLGRVDLRIRGVEAQAHLKVRLDNLAVIVDRVMDTVDRNPQILERLTQGLGEAAGDIGRGAEEAVGDIGRGTQEAVGDVGRGAQEAVGDIGRGAQEVVGDVGRGAESVVEETGRAAGDVTRRTDG